MVSIPTGFHRGNPARIAEIIAKKELQRKGYSLGHLLGEWFADGLLLASWWTGSHN